MSSYRTISDMSKVHDGASTVTTAVKTISRTTMAANSSYGASISEQSRSQHAPSRAHSTPITKKTPPLFRRRASDTKAFIIWIDPHLMRKPLADLASTKNTSTALAKRQSENATTSRRLSGSKWSLEKLEQLKQLHTAVMEEAAARGADLLQLGDKKGVVRQTAVAGTQWIRNSEQDDKHVMIFDDETFHALMRASEENFSQMSDGNISNQREPQQTQGTTRYTDDYPSTEGAQSAGSSTLAGGEMRDHTETQSSHRTRGLTPTAGFKRETHQSRSFSSTTANTIPAQRKERHHKISGGPGRRRELLKQEIAGASKGASAKASERPALQLKRLWRLAAHNNIYVTSASDYWDYIKARARRMGFSVGGRDRASAKLGEPNKTDNFAIQLHPSLPKTNIYSVVMDLSGWFYPVVHDYLRSKFDRPNLPGLEHNYPMLHSLFPEVEKAPHSPFVPLAEIAIKKKKWESRQLGHQPSQEKKIQHVRTKTADVSRQNSKNVSTYHKSPSSHVRTDNKHNSGQKSKTRRDKASRRGDTTESGYEGGSDDGAKEVSDSGQGENEGHGEEPAHKDMPKKPGGEHKAAAPERKCELCGQSFNDRYKHMLDPVHQKKVNQLSFSSLKSYLSENDWKPRYSSDCTPTDGRRGDTYAQSFLRGALPVDSSILILSETSRCGTQSMQRKYIDSYKSSSDHWSRVLEKFTKWLSHSSTRDQTERSIQEMRDGFTRTSSEWESKYQFSLDDDGCFDTTSNAVGGTRGTPNMFERKEKLVTIEKPTDEKRDGLPANQVSSWRFDSIQPGSHLHAKYANNDEEPVAQQMDQFHVPSAASTSNVNIFHTPCFNSKLPDCNLPENNGQADENLAKHQTIEKFSSNSTKPEKLEIENSAVTCQSAVRAAGLNQNISHETEKKYRHCNVRNSSRPADERFPSHQTREVFSANNHEPEKLENSATECQSTARSLQKTAGPDQAIESETEKEPAKCSVRKRHGPADENLPKKQTMEEFSANGSKLEEIETENGTTACLTAVRALEKAADFNRNISSETKRESRTGICRSTDHNGLSMKQSDLNKGVDTTNREKTHPIPADGSFGASTLVSELAENFVRVFYSEEERSVQRITVNNLLNRKNTENLSPPESGNKTALQQSGRQRGNGATSTIESQPVKAATPARQWNHYSLRTRRQNSSNSTFCVATTESVSNDKATNERCPASSERNRKSRLSPEETARSCQATRKSSRLNTGKTAKVSNNDNTSSSSGKKNQQKLKHREGSSATSVPKSVVRTSAKKRRSLTPISRPETRSQVHGKKYSEPQDPQNSCRKREYRSPKRLRF